MAFYDSDTRAAAESARGRALATLHTPNDDPSINSYADANFLRTRLFNYVAAIQSYVLSQGPVCRIRVAVADGRERFGQLQAAAVHQPAFALDDVRRLRL